MCRHNLTNFESLIARLHKAGHIDLELWCVDDTVIRVHRVASGARKGKLPHHDPYRCRNDDHQLELRDKA